MVRQGGVIYKEKGWGGQGPPPLGRDAALRAPLDDDNDDDDDDDDDDDVDAT